MRKGCGMFACTMLLTCQFPVVEARASTGLYEHIEDVDVNPVVAFTRSLAKLNRVSEMCRDVETADYAAYSLLIHQYIKILYHGEAPYWVLADVKERIKDQALCKWMVSESLIHYQFAYQDYMDVVGPKLEPPFLTESMSEPGHMPIDTATLGVARPSKH